MLRYLASGYRDYTVFPIPVMDRVNWEIFVVADGEAAPVFPSEKAVPLQKKYVWVLPPEISYGLRTGTDPVYRYAFCFTRLPDILTHVVHERGYFGRTVTDEEISQIDEIFHRLDHHFHAFLPLSALQVRKAEVDLALLLLNGVKLSAEIPLDKIDEQRIDTVMTWYQEHMSESPTIDAAAATVHISAGHLRRTFKRIRNCSPNEAFIRMRMDYAKKMLRETAEDPVQIGKRSGYRNDGDFCRAFSKHTGLSPQQWRAGIHEQDPR